MQTFSCVACGKPIPHERHMKLFCSDLCKEMSKYVRYARSCKKDDRENDPLVRDALKVRFFWILVGGYNQLQRKVTEKNKAKVLLRDKRKCQACGAAGNQIDHIRGNSNEESNLQVLCLPCHLRKTLSSITSIDGKVSFSLRQSLVDLDLTLRIESQTPLRDCDDEKIWNAKWKGLLEERRNEFFQEVRGLIGSKVNDSLDDLRTYLAEAGILTFSGNSGWSKEYIRELRDGTRRANV